jgi:hypothetical protein
MLLLERMMTMKRIIRLATTLVAIFCFLGLALPVLAWEDCPLGMANDPYPGACPRYIDTNEDGICDHSQADPSLANTGLASSEVVLPSEPLPSVGNESQSIVTVLPETTTPSLSPTTTGSTIVESFPFTPDLDRLSRLSNRNLRSLTVQEMEESYGFPAEVLLSALVGQGIVAEVETTVGNLMQLGDFYRSTFLDFLSSLATEASSTFSSPASSQTPTGTTSASPPLGIPATMTPTPPRTPKQDSAIPGTTLGGGRGNGSRWLTEEWVYFLGTIALLLVIKGLALLRTTSLSRQLPWFTQANIRWWVNVLLTLSFAISFLSGLADFLALTFGWFQGWGSLIVNVHLDSSMVLLAVGFVHTLWHWPYYRSCYQRGKQLRRNPKVFRKWVLNLALTASFLTSLASGLLDLLALRYHWFLGASPTFYDLHLYSSLAMMAIGLVHTFWHMPYYRTRLALAHPTRNKPISIPAEENCRRV